jgi:hypothetical protein
MNQIVKLGKVLLAVSRTSIPAASFRFSRGIGPSFLLPLPLCGFERLTVLSVGAALSMTQTESTGTTKLASFCLSCFVFILIFINLKSDNEGSPTSFEIAC